VVGGAEHDRRDWLGVSTGDIHHEFAYCIHALSAPPGAAAEQDRRACVTESTVGPDTPCYLWGYYLVWRYYPV